jgi:hypothetical protein
VAAPQKWGGICPEAKIIALNVLTKYSNTIKTRPTHAHERRNWRQTKTASLSEWRKKMKRRTLVLAICCGISLASLAQAGSSNDARIVPFKIDKTQQGMGPTDHIKACLKNDLCKSAAEALAEYLGVDSAYIEVAGRIDSDETIGIEHHVWIAPPAGYSFCAIGGFRINSMVPKSGSDAAQLTMIVGQKPGQDSALATMAVLPVRADGGKTWVDAEGYYVALRNGADRSRCTPIGTKLIECKGDSLTKCALNDNEWFKR